ncbi:Endo-1,4-beta-xylanase A precursor [compost metagenome]
MFTRVLANLEGVDLGSYATSAFTDVPAGKWYASAVAWAAQSGIVNGTGQGQFSPDAVITREQMAVMLYNYTATKGYKPRAVTAAEFTDAGSVSHWAQEAVESMAAAGILSGKPGDYADPQGETSRAEAAAVFARLIRAWGAEHS